MMKVLIQNLIDILIRDKDFFLGFFAFAFAIVILCGQILKGIPNPYRKLWQSPPEF